MITAAAAALALSIAFILVPYITGLFIFKSQHESIKETHHNRCFCVDIFPSVHCDLDLLHDLGLILEFTSMTLVSKEFVDQRALSFKASKNPRLKKTW